jgi:hypothetical protein
MLIDGISNSMMSSVSTLIYDAVVNPLIANIASAAVGSATIELAASSQSGAMQLQSAQGASQILVTGAAQAGNILMQGGSVAGNYLAGIAGQAVSMIESITAVMADPAFQDAMAGLGDVMADVGGAMADGIDSITGSIKGSISQADEWAAIQAQRVAAQEAANAAQEAANAAQQAANELLRESESLQVSFYTAMGNTIALRKLELNQLDPSNRALQQSIFNFEDLEKAVKSLADKALSELSNAADATRSKVSSLSNAFSSFDRTNASMMSNDRDFATSIMRDMITGGDVSERNLNLAIDILTDKTTKAYSSMNDYLRDQLRAQSLIGNALSGAEAQLSIEEMTLENLRNQLDMSEEQHEESLSVLMQQLTQAKNIANLLPNYGGSSNTLISVERALLALVDNASFGTFTPSNDNPGSITNTSFTSGVVGSSGATQVNNQSQSNAIVTKLGELLNELEHISAGNVQIASNTGRSLDIARKFDSIGIPPFRSSVGNGG